MQHVMLHHANGSGGGVSIGGVWLQCVVECLACHHRICFPRLQVCTVHMLVSCVLGSGVRMQLVASSILCIGYSYAEGVTYCVEYYS